MKSNPQLCINLRTKLIVRDCNGICCKFCEEFNCQRKCPRSYLKDECWRATPLREEAFRRLFR